MSRLDRMRKIFESNSSTDAAKPDAEKILEEMLDKAIPMAAYYDGTDIERAIFCDAIDEGLSATKIHNAIGKLTEFDKYQNYRCMSILIGVDKIASAFIILGIHPRVTESIDDYLNFKRTAGLARMDEVDDEEEQTDEGRTCNHEQIG